MEHFDDALHYLANVLDGALEVRDGRLKERLRLAVGLLVEREVHGDLIAAEEFSEAFQRVIKPLDRFFACAGRGFADGTWFGFWSWGAWLALRLSLFFPEEVFEFLLEDLF
jgi:hypothetical protein